MEIKVGEYVRTKDGRIGKLDKIYYAGRGTRHYGEDLGKNYYSIKYNADDGFGRYSDEEIVKHSKNIIDLIEVNDIVVYWVDTQSYNGWVQNFVDKELLKDMKKKFINEDIKSIVTHEQIENMEYRV